jgi:NAD(P)-dependent dehydrogenase (short-subunit alcohol dehydrogenase family)
VSSGFFNFLDSLIEKTVLLSFSRIGFSLRRFFWNPDDLAVNMSGKTCIVTGANSGLGFETSKQLARLGARLYMLVRDPVRGEKARQEVIEYAGHSDIVLKVVDLSRLQDVCDFVEKFLGAEKRLDVLINNAGVLLDECECTEDGVEKTFATNILGPFLMTNSLLPLLKGSKPARIINVSSGGMYTQKLELESLQAEKGSFNGVVAYAQTKRAQVILTELLAERLADQGVTVNAMHPGWVDTPGLQTSLPTFARIMKPFLRTPMQGADTLVWLAVAPHLAYVSGKFWHDRHTRPTHKSRRTVSSVRQRQELWEECMRLSDWTEEGSMKQVVSIPVGKR